MIPSLPVIMGAKMRGLDEQNEALFSYVNLEDRVPARHPLRLIREIVNAALARLDGTFDKLYAADGRPSIAPERLLRAALIQILFSVRSERQLMEQMQYNLLFRWFVGLGIDEAVWVPTVFSKNRDRLLTTDIARQFLAAILADKAVAPLLSDEHFSVDGTLIQAWASMKSFQPKTAIGTKPPASGDAGPGQDSGASAPEPAACDGEGPNQADGAPAAEQPATGRNAEVDFHGQKRSNDTHASRTDPEARLYRKGPGKEARLCFMGHALMENRNGLVVDACLAEADGHAERWCSRLRTRTPSWCRRFWWSTASGFISSPSGADATGAIQPVASVPSMARIEVVNSIGKGMARRSSPPSAGISRRAGLPNPWKLLPQAPFGQQCMS